MSYGRGKSFCKKDILMMILMNRVVEFVSSNVNGLNVPVKQESVLMHLKKT